jgi:hypothetical protein
VKSVPHKTNKKTDNSHYGAKIRLRVEAVNRCKSKNLYVLDAYAGYGHMWREVQRQCPKVKIRTLGIDQRPIGPHLIKGDNLKVLPSLDLAAFDIIDLDAYGIPAAQLAIVAQKAPGVPVVVTAIASRMATLPHLILGSMGIPGEWSHVNSQLHSIMHIGWRGWDHYCYSLGYSETLRFRFSDAGMEKMYQLLQ